MRTLYPRRAAALALALATPLLISTAYAASNKIPASHAQVLQLVERNSASYIETSRQIWEHPELGYHEVRSSAALQAALRKDGFTVTAPVADEPTGFIATYGEGKPVIGILGEFDALPGLSQDTVPVRKVLTDGGPGHACGHNLLGSGAALAAVALREFMVRNHVKGTLRYYGTPAEEGGDGKVYMLRAGLFKDTDVVLQWHPADRNAVSSGGMLAIVSAKFIFHGVAAHAAMAPDRGRSALDAVMLMGTGIEYMREHVPSNTRIHYIVTKGGVAPNVVPDLSELYLMARSPDLGTLDDVWARLQKIAQGAGLMTETQLETKVIGGDANILGNDVLAKLAQHNLEQVGGFRYTQQEQQFALELQKTLPPGGARPLDTSVKVEPLTPFDPNSPAASTDVGDVSWNVPTIGFSTATFVPGVSAHTWQAAASARMSIGQRGMVVAAKAMALTGLDLLVDPQLVAAARTEFERQLQGKQYRSFIPEGQKPPLDYRN